MKLRQADFFDAHPVFYPWPEILRRVGFSKLFKPREVKFKKWLDLLEIKGGKNVLDVGCGDGVFLERLARTYSINGTGIDISPKSIERAKKTSLKSLRFIVADSADLPFADNSFDYVLSFDTLEHVGDPESLVRTEIKQKKAVSEMARVLKPGGKLLIYTINKSQKYTWNWWLNKLRIDIYKKYAHHPNLFLDPSLLEGYLEEEGLVVEKKELFNAFFTLLADEAIMILAMILTSFFPGTFIGVVFINMADLFSRSFLPILELLDKPLIKGGYSNSFFILARKK